MTASFAFFAVFGPRGPGDASAVFCVAHSLQRQPWQALSPGVERVSPEGASPALRPVSEFDWTRVGAFLTLCRPRGGVSWRCPGGSCAVTHFERACSVPLVFFHQTLSCIWCCGSLVTTVSCFATRLVKGGGIFVGCWSPRDQC